MPTSRKNKDRKDNLNKFKERQKNKRMSEQNQMPAIRQIRQIPVWAQDAEFTLTGTEFMILQNFVNMFAEPVMAMQQVFTRHQDSGTIQTRYQDADGKEVSKDEVDAYLKQMQEYFANGGTAPTAEDSTEPAPKSTKRLKKTAPTESAPSEA